LGEDKWGVGVFDSADTPANPFETNEFKVFTSEGNDITADEGNSGPTEIEEQPAAFKLLHVFVRPGLAVRGDDYGPMVTAAAPSPMVTAAAPEEQAVS